MTLGSEHEVKTGSEVTASPGGLYVVEKRVELAVSSTGQQYLDELKESMGKKWVKDSHITILNAVQAGIIFNEYEMDPSDPDAMEWFEGVIANRSAEASDGKDKGKGSRLATLGADVFPDESSKYYVGFELDEEGTRQIRDETEELFEHFGVEAVHSDEQPHASIFEADSQQYAEYLAGSLNTVLGDVVQIVPSNQLEAVPYSPHRPY